MELIFKVFLIIGMVYTLSSCKGHKTCPTYMEVPKITVNGNV